MQRDNFTCQLCNDTETTLNIHHKEYTKKDIWNEKNENLVTICKLCHNIMHQDDSFIKNRFFDWKAIIYRTLYWDINDTKAYDVIVVFSHVIEIWKQTDSKYDGIKASKMVSVYRESFEMLRKSIPEVDNG